MFFIGLFKKSPVNVLIFSLSLSHTLRCIHRILYVILYILCMYHPSRYNCIQIKIHSDTYVLIYINNDML